MPSSASRSTRECRVVGSTRRTATVASDGARGHQGRTKRLRAGHAPGAEDEARGDDPAGDGQDSAGPGDGSRVGGVRTAGPASGHPAVDASPSG